MVGITLRGLAARWTAIIALAVLVAPALLGGCASGPLAGAAKIKGSIVATKDLNPDRRGRASPVVIKLYELKSTAAFESADFFSLYEREREALGADLLAVEEVTLAPGDTRPLERTLQPGTRFLGVVAAYRDIERAQWRATVPLAAKGSTALTVRVDGARVWVQSRD